MLSEMGVVVVAAHLICSNHEINIFFSFLFSVSKNLNCPIADDNCGHQEESKKEAATGHDGAEEFCCTMIFLHF